MKSKLTEQVIALADGTRSVREISEEINRGDQRSSVYRILRREGLQDMVVGAYHSRGLREICCQQRKALKAILALDPKSPQGKLAAMGLEGIK